MDLPFRMNFDRIEVVDMLYSGYSLKVDNRDNKYGPPAISDYIYVKLKQIILYNST